MVKDYEDGIAKELQQTSYSSGGQTLTTISTRSHQPQEGPTSVKKPKLTDTVVESTSSGYAMGCEWSIGTL